MLNNIVDLGSYASDIIIIDFRAYFDTFDYNILAISTLSFTFIFI